MRSSICRREPGVVEIENIVIALSQAEKYGSPIAPTMRLIASDSRQYQYLKLEERVGKIPAKMSMPVVVLIMLPVVVLIVAPTVIALLNSLGGIMRLRLTDLGLLAVITLVLTGCTGHSTMQSEDPKARLQSDRELAEVALVGGRPGSAIDIYRQQLESRPGDVELLYLLGMAYNQTGEFDLALHFLDKAKAQDIAVKQHVRGDILRELGASQIGAGGGYPAGTARFRVCC